MIDFSVTDHTVVDKFVVIEPFTVLESETLTKSATCNETSNVAIKIKEFDTTASLVLTAHNGSSIISKILFLSKLFLIIQLRHYGELARQSNPIMQVD